LLILLLIIETALLMVIIVASFQGRQAFPGLSPFRSFQPQCSTLTATTASQNVENQTVLFTCGERSALAMRVFFMLIPEKSAPVLVVVPTFSLPTGYLCLYLTNAVLGCSYEYAFLNSGESIVVGGPTWSYNYCAIIDNSVPGIGGFTLDWSPGEPPTYRSSPFQLTASPSSVTISPGQTASSTITVTALGGWRGNVSFYGQLVSVENRGIAGMNVSSVAPYGPLGFSFSPRSVMVFADISNLTTVTIPTKECTTGAGYCTPPGVYKMEVFASTACQVVLQGFCADGFAPATADIAITVT